MFYRSITGGEKMSKGSEISFMGQVMKCFDLAIDNQVAKRSVSQLWYLGDPCYVVDSDDWDLFCQKTYDDTAQKNGAENGMDSIIEWKGERLEIWSNGGDGSWHFDFTHTGHNDTPLNGNKAQFCVDAGIFCIMPVKICDTYDIDELKRLGMLFRKEPDLRVEDNVVYINDVADNSVSECYECGEEGQHLDTGWSCDNGVCSGCEHCFECGCEEE